MEEGDDMPDLAFGQEEAMEGGGGQGGGQGDVGKQQVEEGSDIEEDIGDMLETMLESEEEDEQIHGGDARLGSKAGGMASARQEKYAALLKLPRRSDGTIDVDALTAEHRKVYNACVKGLDYFVSFSDLMLCRISSLSFFL